MPSGFDNLCVVIGRTRHKMVQIEIQEAAKRGARMIELRLDFLAKAPDFKRLLDDKPCPIVATVRRPQDGGRWGGSEDARKTLIRQAIVSGFDWVDLETDIADEIRRFKDVKRIISYHNLREVPADLPRIYERMCKQDPDVIKIAVRALSPGDNLRVLEFLQDPPFPTVAFCMGDMGIPSRVLGARFGSPFTYAAFNKERGMAPGMLSFDELGRIYNYGTLNKESGVYGVVGDPVGHSLSPLIHNAAFRQLGINAVYLPFRVPTAVFPDFLRDFERIPVQGYSVTIPHKQAAATLANTRDDAVERVHAANTLIRLPSGDLAAYNTDFQAALDSLQAHFRATAPPDMPAYGVETRTVLILGAGGVARAIAHALQRAGAAITITNRTADRGQQLAEEVGCRTVEWAARHSVICDLLINCTSVGMHPEVDVMPIHHGSLKTGLHVFDTVYTPETTLLVKEARNRGCHVLTGVDMFVRQAALQFKLFTGQEPPLDLMTKVVRQAISPLTAREEAS